MRSSAAEKVPRSVPLSAAVQEQARSSFTGKEDIRLMQGSTITVQSSSPAKPDQDNSTSTKERLYGWSIADAML